MQALLDWWAPLREQGGLGLTGLFRNLGSGITVQECMYVSQLFSKKRLISFSPPIKGCPVENAQICA
jgi:hypothetical protein